MAKKKPEGGKHGLTPGKAGLIGVLAVVLVGVLYVQFSGAAKDDFSAATAEENQQPTLTNAAAQTPVKSAITDAELEKNAEESALAFDQERWKSPELSTVSSYDPFALPAKFPQPPKGIDPLNPAVAMDATTAAERAKELAVAVEELRTQLEELKERGVHVIVNQGDQYVAMIGDRMIHVGDDINGFTVTAIGPHGVRVERKDPQ